MALDMHTPTVDDLAEICRTLERWQVDDGPVQLHPGDLGWFSLRGAQATADAVRVWSSGGLPVAISLLDGPQLLRLAMDARHRGDEAVAERIAADASNAAAGVLDDGEAAVEARGAEALGAALAARGWVTDEPWTPLHRDLADPVEVVGARVETVASDDTAAWVRVHWSAFRGGDIPDDKLREFTGGWRAAAATPFFERARILSARSPEGQVVAVSAVWSSGEGRPGLIEPMGVHEQHRGRGYGTAITAAAAAALRELGSSSAIVCAEATNTGAISTYVAAGFEARQDVNDWARS